MQKKILTFLLLSSIALMLSACNEGNSKIGVINEEKVFTDSNVAKAGVTYLDGISAKLQPELASMQKQIEKSPNNKALQEDMNKRFYDMQEQFGVEKQKVVNKVNAAYAAARDKYRKDAGFSILISSESALSFDSTIDVTDALITEMNKSSVEFSANTEDGATTTNSTAKATTSNATEKMAAQPSNATAK